MTYNPRQRLLALTQEGATASIHAEAGTRSAEVLLYGPIGGWFGVDALSFAQQIADLDVDRIHVRVNSPGGDVWDGLAIMNALRGHTAAIDITVEGLAASAASFIVQAGDTRTMALGSQMLVHDAWGVAIGNEADMIEMASTLGKVSGSIASVYASRAGGTTDDWRETMRAETWYTAEEAVSAGLADTAETTAAEDAPAAAASFDLGVFAYAGRAEAPAPRISRPTATIRTDVQIINHEGSRAVAFTDEQLTSMRSDLGLAADADEATIVAALTELATEDAAPAAKLPAGVTTIDTGVLAELQANARAGAEAREQQAVERRERIVNEAIAAGKFGHARKADWLNALAKNEAGAVADIESLAPGLIPVGSVIGDSTATDTMDADSALLASLGMKG